MDCKLSMRVAGITLLIIILTGLLSYIFNLPEDIGLDVPDGKLNSLSFAPFREGQSPLLLQFPTPQQIDEDLALMADKTRTIRTYSISEGMSVIPGLARKHGLQMIQGAWIGYLDADSRVEIEALVQAANTYPDVIKRVIVGNEVLLRGEQPPEKLVQYIREVKQRVKQPVSYADVWSMYMKHPELIKEVDFITIHILPYWEDEPIPVENAPAHIERIYKQVQQEAEAIAPGKPILIGETGWPSMGKQRGWAIPGVVNEAKFIRGLLKVAADNHFDVNIVEAFNQSWKSELEGVIGANWGLYSVDREEVFPLTGPVYENAKWGMQFLIAAVLMVLITVYYARKLAVLPTGKIIAFLVFAQILALLLTYLGDQSWYASYDNWQRFRSILVILLNITVIVLVLSRACDILKDEATSVAKSGALTWVFAVVLLVSMYKTYLLATDGRYVSFPFSITLIPVMSLLGLFCLQSWLHQLKLANFNLHSLIGHKINANQYDKQIGWLILLYMAGLVIGEIIAFAVARDFVQAYPGFGQRLGWAAIFTITNRQLLLWLACLAVLALTRLAGNPRNQ